jgi:hypothetical protein
MYIQGDTNIYMGGIDASNIDEIPVANWLVKFDQKQMQFYLQRTKDFNVPEKMYGDVKEVADKYLKSFNHYDKNLGVLLSGLKGTGKSMTARYTAIASKLPVLIVSEGYGGTEFNQFLSSINQECVILLDEFEKVFREPEHQQSLLSILDGVFPTKFLFLLTINEVSRMDTYFMNRPGRIHYAKHYKGLEDGIITMVCEDMLEDKSKIPEIVKVCNFLGDVSMDIVTSVIKECNLYKDETPRQLVDSMNLQPEDASFKVDVYVDGVLYKENAFFDENPYGFDDDSDFNIDWYGKSFESTVPNAKDEWVGVRYRSHMFPSVKSEITNKDMRMTFIVPDQHIQYAELKDETKPWDINTNPVIDTHYKPHDFNIKLVFRKSVYSRKTLGGF